MKTHEISSCPLNGCVERSMPEKGKRSMNSKSKSRVTRTCSLREIRLLWTVLLLTSSSHASALCERWGPPQVLGHLDATLLPEASGMAIAPGGNQLFLHNDGNENAFFASDRSGANLQRVDLGGFAPEDIEDMALGPCGERECLFVGDIGDNGQRRSTVQIAVADLAPRFSAHVTLKTLIDARYPDGPHDAEALAVHPSGDLFVVTKSGSGLGRSGPARVYRLTAAQVAAGSSQQFEFRGEIPVSIMSHTLIASRRVVTAMDIATEGDRFVLLTYDAIIEAAADLTQPLPAPAAWAEGRNYRVSSIAPLLQAEAVAYDRSGRGILYTTESVGGWPAPLISQVCDAP